ncbi:metalloprotease secretion chaperone CpaB [Roseateles koreensis]|uniref:Metalloprotease secretion chaperone CpaB n=1 Tax=Roseateles koreensis TaxID=2987526 RepID=A0ABT5KXC0_9BURK|nr:metalloprotease secretion chaperone CpaB [Roseateles koreensis]MDC8787040.1 metalloprotease secretion chaperone CpaB [Roseateles koreensis]
MATPNRLTLFAGGVAVLLGGLVWVNQADRASAPVVPTNAPGASAASAALAAPQPEAFPGLVPQTSASPTTAKASTLSLDQAQQRRPQSRLDPQLFAAGAKKTAVLVLADPEVAKAHLWPAARQSLIPNRQFVQFDPYVLEAREAEQRFDLMVPQLGVTYQAVIDLVEARGDIVRWQGRLTDDSGDVGQFSFTQTLSDHYTIGAISLPLGRFNMEAKNGYGWMHSEADGFQLPANGQDVLHDH